MNVNGIRRLYAYCDWANERMLSAIAGLSEEQFTRDIVSSFASIRETLSHIAFAEWLWLQRYKGSSPMEMPEWTESRSFEVLRDRMRATAADRRAYLDTLSDEAVESTISYRSTSGDPFTMQLADVLVHCANHSTYHRGQLVTMLRQVGATPPGTDFNVFARSE